MKKKIESVESLLMLVCDRVGRSFINVLGLGSRVLLGLLFLTSLLFRGILYLPKGEWVAIYPINIWVILLLIVLMCGLYYSRSYWQRISLGKLFAAGAVFYLLVGLFLIVGTSDRLRYDAAQVFRAAVSLNAGNLDSLAVGAYLYRFPHQLGLVSFERLVLTLLPIPSSIVFFVVNLLLVLGINFSLWKLTDRLFANDRISRYTLFLSFAFLPQLFHILFVYGLIIGLFFASTGLVFLLDYLQKKNWQAAWLSLLFLSAAYWIRNNYIILLVAVSLVILLESWWTRTKKFLLFPVLLVFLSGLMNRATLTHYQTISGQSLEGMPKVTWLAMGLQDHPSSIRRPGWYNLYVTDIYKEKNGDYQAIKQHSQGILQERLATFKERPLYALSFFATKFATTWTESTFASVWSGPSKIWKQPHRMNWLTDLYQGGLSYRVLYTLTHALLILMYAGAFLFVCLRPIRESRPIDWLFPLYLGGGVVFHLFWETKSQYVYPYVFFLIPLAAAAYVRIEQQLASGRLKKTDS